MTFICREVKGKVPCWSSNGMEVDIKIKPAEALEDGTIRTTLEGAGECNLMEQIMGVCDHSTSLTATILAFSGVLQYISL